MKSETKLIKYITTKYSELENRKIEGKNNIKRYTVPIMSQYVENGIAILLDDILKEKKYNYLIDPQLSVGNGKVLRPDIIIFDENDVIHGIVEVKAQLGYAGNFNKEIYFNHLKTIKEAAKNKTLRTNGVEKHDFSLAKNFKDLIIILMAANDHKNKDNFQGTNYFILFDDHNGNRGLWYNSIDRFLNNNEKDLHSYNRLINFIKDL